MAKKKDRDRINPLNSWLKKLTASEKILIVLCSFVLISTVIYMFFKAPLGFSADSGVPISLAEEIISSGEIFPSGWNCRRDIPVFSAHTVLLPLTLFMDNQMLMFSITGAIFIILTFLASYYCSSVTSYSVKRNCCFIFFALFLCGNSSRFDLIVYDQLSYLPVFTIIMLIVPMFISCLDEELCIKSYKRFFVLCVILTILGIAGMRYVQTLDIPILGAICIYYLIIKNNEDLSDLFKSKKFYSFIIFAIGICASTVLGYIAHKLACKYVNFLPSASNTDFSSNFLTSLQDFYSLLLRLLGIQSGISIFSIEGIVNSIKLIFGVIFLIILPIFQIKKYKYENTQMKLFTLFTIVHVFEIVFLAFFGNTITAPRYMFTSMLLLFYLSAHYISKYIISNSFDVKSFVAVACVCVYVLPIATPKFFSFIGYEEAINEKTAIVKHLQEKGLTHGYGEYWTTVPISYYSNSNITIAKTTTNPILPHKSNCADRLYQENYYQGKSFYIASTEEYNSQFLNSTSYKAFGEPAEVDVFENYHIYIYDYNIANSDFSGLKGGFNGKDYTEIFTAMNQYEAIGIVKYTHEEGFYLISSNFSYGAANDNDKIMILTKETLPSSVIENSKQEKNYNDYSVYITNVKTIRNIKNNNYIGNPRFVDDNKWIMGSGIEIKKTDNIVHIECVDLADRTIQQNVSIPIELIGKPVTLSIYVDDYYGDCVLRVTDNLTDTEYVSDELNQKAHLFSYTFVPTSNSICISPCTPRDVKYYLDIKYIKLEAGGIATNLDSDAEIFYNDNLIINPDFEQDTIDAWMIGTGHELYIKNNSIKVTCIQEYDRAFQQDITIPNELIGHPVTFSIDVSEYSGEIITRISDSDNSEIVYVRQALVREGINTYTFIPQDNDIRIQPAVPKNIGDSVTFNYVKLEEGAAATPQLSDAA